VAMGRRQDEARATRDEGAADQRERSAVEKEKKKKRRTRRLQHRHAFERKGRDVMKKGDNPPSRFASERGPCTCREEKRTCWGAEVEWCEYSV
jgi:hypothetical protein